MNDLVSSIYTFVCDPDECDCLIQVTTSDGFGFPSGVTKLTCPCGRNTALVSVEHATIQPTNQTKGNTMDGMTVENLPLSDSEKYNPNLLVTYKKVAGTYASPEAPEYITDKVVDIEWELHNSRLNSKVVSVLQNKISSVKEIIESNWQEAVDEGYSDVLVSIAEALDIPLVREIEWSATIEVSGVITVDLLENSNFDLQYEIEDAIYADSHNGNIEVADQEVCNVRENC